MGDYRQETSDYQQLGPTQRPLPHGQKQATAGKERTFQSVDYITPQQKMQLTLFSYCGADRKRNSAFLLYYVYIQNHVKWLTKPSKYTLLIPLTFY